MNQISMKMNRPENTSFQASQSGQDGVNPSGGRRDRGRGPRKLWVLSLLAFLLPVVILLIAFGVQKVFPFGDRHILTVDLYHQYAPFVAELRRKILSGSSFFFSWAAGLGINFFALFTYYLASPINLISVIFPESFLSECILTIVLLKIGFSGLFFERFLRNYARRTGPLAVAFSVAYSLSAYVLAYFWNIMWLDTVMLLPLAALGLVKLVRDGKAWLYVIGLSLIILTNYYTGFFACVFLGLLFLLLMMRYQTDQLPSKKVLTWAQMLFYTLLSVGISMITLLPTILALKRTSAVGDVAPASFDRFNAMLDLIPRFMPLSEPNIRSGQANLYVGLLPVLLIGFFFISRRIRKKERVVSGLILSFLLLSFNNNWLNFLWHGGHYPNQLPYRFSFVFCFLFLVSAYESFPGLRNIPEASIQKMAILWVGLLFLMEKMDLTTFSSLDLWLIISLVFIYSFILKAYARQFYQSRNGNLRMRTSNPQNEVRALALILAILMVSELAVNTILAVDTVGRNEYFGLRENYQAGEEPENIRKLVQRYHQIEKNNLVRMEIMPDHSVNDSMLYGTNGLTIFSSTFPKKPVRSLAALGYANNGINSFQYYGSTPVVDSLMGICYRIQRGEMGIDERFLQKVEESGTVSVWENPQALPIAYGVPETVLERKTVLMKDNPFQTQTIFMNLLTGTVEQPFEYLKWKAADSEKSLGLEPSGATTEVSDISIEQVDHLYSVTLDENGKGTVWALLEPERDGSYYLGWNLSGGRISEISLKTGEGRWTTVGKKTAGVTELGWAEAQKKILIKITLENDAGAHSLSQLRLYGARLQEAALLKALDGLSPYETKITEFQTNDLAVEWYSKIPGALVLTTTFDPGWSCTVDGEKVEIQLVDETYPIVPVPEGNHVVRFHFVPAGFKTGALVSLISLGVALLLVFAPLLKNHCTKKSGAFTQKEENVFEASDPQNGSAEAQPQEGQSFEIPNFISLSKTEDSSNDFDLKI